MQATVESAPYTIAPVISTTVVGATGVLVGVIIWAVNKPEKKVAAAQAAEAFFRVNARQLRHDLARGAGPSIEDLAAAAEIAPHNLARFSSVLHEHRAEILALAAPDTLTPERALETMEFIGEIARADPSLHDDYERFRATYAEAR